MVTYDFGEFVHNSVSNRPKEKLANVFLTKASSGDILLADGAAYEVDDTSHSTLMSEPSLHTRGLGSNSFYKISADGDVLTLASGQKLTDVTLVKVEDCRSCGGEAEFVDSLNGIDGVRCTECGEVIQTI